VATVKGSTLGVANKPESATQMTATQVAGGDGGRGEELVGHQETPKRQIGDASKWWAEDVSDEEHGSISSERIQDGSRRTEEEWPSLPAKVNPSTKP